MLDFAPPSVDKIGRGANSDAKAERHRVPSGIIFWKQKSETAKSLFECKAARQFCLPQAAVKLSVPSVARNMFLYFVQDNQFCLPTVGKVGECRTDPSGN